MGLLRGVGGFYVLIALYYAWFFALRGEPTTLMQLVALLSAAAWLILAPPSRAEWFHGWRAWMLQAAVVGIAVLVFVTMDRDSHSVSDTLNRIVPSYALLAALVLRLRYPGRARANS